MTISTSANSVTLQGNGVTTVFSYSFIMGTATNAVVTYTDAAGNETVLTPSQYTLTINAAASGQIWGVGGTVTYPITGSPIAAGTSLTIQRIVPFTQTTSISNQGDFYPQAVEAAMDTLEMQIQQVSAGEANSIQAPPTDPSGLTYTLPAVAQRAAQFVSFDSNGNVIVGLPPGSGAPISSVMQPVVDAATLALARTAMGAMGDADANNMTGAVNFAKGTIASAATTNIGAANVNYLQVTGTTTITAFDTIQAGTVRILEFAASLTLTYNATSLILPGPANITTNAGDIAVVVSEGSGNWRCLGYSFAKALPGKQPTRTTLTSGTSATYTTPAGASRLFIRMAGGGGGGGPAGSVSGAALSGGATSFNSIGAAAGTFGSQTGSPGSGGTGGGGTASLRIPGAWGGVGPELALFGGRGGATQLGPGGAESYGGSSGNNAPANTGGGGGGASANNTGVPDGAGGGGGEYVELIITSPAASYTYTVGVGGNGGTGGNNGGAGAAGIIIIDEYYN